MRIFRQFSSLSTFPFHELEDLRSKTRCLCGFAVHRLQVADMKKKKTLPRLCVTSSNKLRLASAWAPLVSCEQEFLSNQRESAFKTTATGHKTESHIYGVASGRVFSHIEGRFHKDVGVKVGWEGQIS